MPEDGLGIEAGANCGRCDGALEKGTMSDDWSRFAVPKAVPEQSVKRTKVAVASKSVALLLTVELVTRPVAYTKMRSQESG